MHLTAAECIPKRRAKGLKSHRVFGEGETTLLCDLCAGTKEISEIDLSAGLGWGPPQG